MMTDLPPELEILQEYYPVNRIRARMDELGMTLGQLSRLTGIDKSSLSRYIREGMKPSVYAGQLIAQGLESSVARLWPLDDSHESDEG